MDVDGQFEVERLNIAFDVAFPSAAFTGLGGEAFEVAVKVLFSIKSQTIPVTPAHSPSWSEGRILKRSVLFFCPVIPPAATAALKRLLQVV